jgi:hypothetical protein
MTIRQVPLDKKNIIDFSFATSEGVHQSMKGPLEDIAVQNK